MKLQTTHVFLGGMRIALGWLLLWAFFDKLLGLGFATAPEKAWIHGASPCEGFLQNAVKGPCSEAFHAMAGYAIVDWLFMLGLLFIGAAMILGITQRIAGYTGALLMLLMWLAVLPPEHNPLIDEHIVYMLMFLFFAVSGDAGEWLGFGTQWKKNAVVKKWPWLA